MKHAALPREAKFPLFIRCPFGCSIAASINPTERKPMERQIRQNDAPVKRKDLHHIVTDTIIQQLKAGVVPWHQPWIGNAGLPRNATTAKPIAVLISCCYGVPA
jgi:hypothetical protein